MNIGSEIFEEKRGRSPRNLKAEVLYYLTKFGLGHNHPQTDGQIAYHIFTPDVHISSQKVVVRRIIRELRKKHLIVSDARGYWLPVSEEDREPTREYIEKIGKRAKMIFCLVKPQKLAFARQFDEQLPIEGI